MKDLPVGRRMMDVATFTDRNGITYTGEALMLAMLLHANGKKAKRGKRNKNDLHEIQEIMLDPNLED